MERIFGRLLMLMLFVSMLFRLYSRLVRLELIIVYSIGKWYFRLILYIVGLVILRQVEIVVGIEILCLFCLWLVMMMLIIVDVWVIFDSVISGYIGVLFMFWIICILIVRVVWWILVIISGVQRKLNSVVLIGVKLLVNRWCIVKVMLLLIRWLNGLIIVWVRNIVRISEQIGIIIRQRQLGMMCLRCVLIKFKVRLVSRVGIICVWQLILVMVNRLKFYIFGICWLRRQVFISCGEMRVMLRMILRIGVLFIFFIVDQQIFIGRQKKIVLLISYRKLQMVFSDGCIWVSVWLLFMGRLLIMLWKLRIRLLLIRVGSRGKKILVKCEINCLCYFIFCCVVCLICFLLVEVWLVVVSRVLQ